MDARAWLLVGATTVLAAGVLVVWVVMADPLSRGVKDAIETLTALPGWLWPIVGVAFALVNAAAEEAAYRGIIQQALSATFGSRTAIVLQAVAFGALHREGFPSGVSGVVLSAGYGVVLGVLRASTGGLLAPWIAHVVADAAIFVVVLVMIA